MHFWEICVPECDWGNKHIREKCFLVMKKKKLLTVLSLSWGTHNKLPSPFVYSMDFWSFASLVASVT